MTRRKQMGAKKWGGGFTLVELSIVLVIVGLILASITASSALIRQAEIRAVINELQQYHTAYSTFKAAYDGIPGDMKDATNFFDPAMCEVTANTCNGDGNGRILSALDDTDEVRAAMKHLSLAHLINQQMNAVTSDGVTPLVISSSAPKSKFQGAGYMLLNGTNGGSLDQGGTIPSPFDATTNALYLGTASTIPGEVLINGSVNGYYAYSIDKKIDDGQIDRGQLIGFNAGKIRVVNSLTYPFCISGTSYIVENPVGNSCILGYSMD